MREKPADLLSTREAAALLGLSKSRVDQLARSGRIPSVRVGAVRLFRRADVLAFGKLDRPAGRPPLS